MRDFLATVLLFPLSFGNVLAHFTMQYIWVDGIQQPWGEYIRMQGDNFPVTDVTSTDMICNPSGLSGQGVATKQVRPGANITFEWHQHVNVTGETPLSFGHKGPTQIFATLVPAAVNAADYEPTGQVWTKIYGSGLQYINSAEPDGWWATDIVNENDGRHSIVLPSCLPDGTYLIRAENVALDLATSLYGAQWYIGCVHIQINSSLSTTTTSSLSVAAQKAWSQRPLYNLVNLYSPTDPGVLVNIYYGLENYTIPGPAAWTC